MPRADLVELQLAKLRRVLAWAKDRSPHYRRTLAGVEPEQLRTWADVDRIPFLTREEWMASQEAHPPFGELPVTGAHDAIRLHTTSGTSGRTPLRALDSRKDWSWSAEMWCYALWGAGVRPHDIAYVAFGYGSFIGFWGLHNGLEKIGALTIPGGAQSTAQRVRQIHDFGATVVASTPTYALRLAAEPRELGIDLVNGPVRRVILSGEPAGSIPETKALIERKWGAAGLRHRRHDRGVDDRHVRAGRAARRLPRHRGPPPGGGHRPGHRPRGRLRRARRAGLHLVRSVDTPLVRYRTADLVVKVPGSRTTSGRTFDLYEGGIIGRVDDMKLVRGTNVYPGAIEAIVRGFDGIEEFQIRISRPGDRDEIELLLEPAATVDDTGWDLLSGRVAAELADSHEGLRFHVRRAATGELPRFELKAKRLTDLRPAV
ncbi:hypothetical protein L7F22_000063 [Adiantum nelumboides]|nr:hypothetical protein [Adiantum nelumboides]